MRQITSSNPQRGTVYRDVNRADAALHAGAYATPISSHSGLGASFPRAGAVSCVTALAWHSLSTLGRPPSLVARPGRHQTDRGAGKGAREARESDLEGARRSGSLCTSREGGGSCHRGMTSKQTGIPYYRTCVRFSTKTREVLDFAPLLEANPVGFHYASSIHRELRTVPRALPLFPAIFLS
jgi:hypothetical protein